MNKVEELILRGLATSEKSLWELLEVSQFPLKDFLQAIEGLRAKGLIAPTAKGIRLTQKGAEAVDGRSTAYASSVCDRCAGKGILPEGRFEDVLSEFKKLVRGRPSPSLSFFQGYMREEDVVARAALMHLRGDLHRREIVLVGDDDLLSIALCLTGMPSRVCVLDVDERLGDFIRRVARERGFDVEFRRYDVSEPLPEDLVGAFDVFSSEPLETLSGLRAFVARGVSCLGEDGVGYLGLTLLEASLKKWAAVERLLLAMNCVVTDVIRDFSRYPMRYGELSYETFVERLSFPVSENPGIDWYKATLFRFEVMGKPRLVIAPNKRLRISYVDPEEDLTYPSRER
ncbi:MAG: bis-aminopropyl spermidine synthase family protein [Hadesarchaea archaeon]|nr:bis-aminopropyl spermidine synthase family protein [Hadesarchaea archaeon]